MRMLLLGLAALAMLAAVETAEAKTCDQMAIGCMEKGGSHSKCYNPSNLRTCKKTGVWVGPYTGQVVRATKK